MAASARHASQARIRHVLLCALHTPAACRSFAISTAACCAAYCRPSLSATHTARSCAVRCTCVLHAASARACSRSKTLLCTSVSNASSRTYRHLLWYDSMRFVVAGLPLPQRRLLSRRAGLVPRGVEGGRTRLGRGDAVAEDRFENGSGRDAPPCAVVVRIRMRVGCGLDCRPERADGTCCLSSSAIERRATPTCLLYSASSCMLVRPGRTAHRLFKGRLHLPHRQLSKDYVQGAPQTRRI